MAAVVRRAGPVEVLVDLVALRAVASEEEEAAVVAAEAAVDSAEVAVAAAEVLVEAMKPPIIAST
jgi:hypothetical protein